MAKSNSLSSVTFICVNLLLIIHLPCETNGHLYDILKVDTEPTVGQPVSPDRMFQYISAGVPQIFWTFVNSGHLDGLNFVGSSCKQSLLTIAGGLKDGHLTSYKFLDSAGKTPSGFIRTTIASFGDFDECLSINGDLVRGVKVTAKYCAFDMHPFKVANFTREEKLSTKIPFSLDQVPIFKGMALVGSICVPDECSKDETQVILTKVLQPFGLKVAGDTNCDTRESISFVSKVRSMTTHQIVAGLLIASMVAMVITCTGVHLYSSLIDPTWCPCPSIVHGMSMVTGWKNLFWAKPSTYEVIIFDVMKTGIILSGTVGHILVCAEMPISYYMLDRHETLNYIFASPETQMLLNDAGLVGVTVLSGIATSLIAYPLAIKRKLPFLPALLDRFLRFAPAMAILTALEFLWPFAGNGPIYSRVANFVVNKCTKNWWLNLLFINNALDAIDICAGSSFYSSVDMHLFILGLIVIYILAWRPKVALVTCCLLSVASYTRVAFNIITNETIGVLFRPDPVPIKLADYFTYVHMTTETYVPGYLLGVFIGYLMVIGKAVPLVSNYKDHLKWLTVIQLIFGSVTLCTLLYNSVQIVPESMTFFVVIFNRSMQAIGTAFLFLYLISLKPTPTSQQPLTDKSTQPTESIQSPQPTESTQLTGDADVKKKENSAPKPESKVEFSFLKAISRLSFALYVCNYLVIRTLFYSSRNPFPTTGFDMVTRSISFMVLIYIASLVFHLLFLGPLDELRKLLISPSSKRKSD